MPGNVSSDAGLHHKDMLHALLLRAQPGGTIGDTPEICASRHPVTSVAHFHSCPTIAAQLTHLKRCLQVVDLPAATRELPAVAKPRGDVTSDTDIAEDLEQKAQAKAEKLRQMQERLNAWQASQEAQQ